MRAASDETLSLYRFANRLALDLRRGALHDGFTPFGRVATLSVRNKVGASDMKNRALFQAANGWTVGLRRSVIRRGISLLALTLPAALLNLGLAYLASKWLDAGDFGIYYAAITAINIAFAPAMIVNLFFTRAVAAIGAEYGVASAKAASNQVFRFIASWGGVLTIASGLIAAALWLASAKFALPVALLSFLILYISYCSEAGRIALQGDGRFIHLGVYSLAWMAARFIGGALGIFLFRSVWAGLAGIAIAIILPVLVLFQPWKMIRQRFFFPWRSEETENAKFLSMIRVSAFANLSAGFLLFMLAANADILVAYAILDPTNLAIYSASSVLPKGLLIATLPLIQLLFPLIVGERANARPTIALIIRGALLTLAVAGGGGAFIMLLADPLCAGGRGISFCSNDVMAYGLAAIVAMSLLRLAVSADYAARNDFIPILLIAPIVIGGALALDRNISAPIDLARFYATFSGVTLLGYGTASFAFRAFRLMRIKAQQAAGATGS